MNLFTSSRERRLWLWSLVVVVAIYSTLGLAGTLVEVLRDRNMLDNAMFMGFLILMVVIAVSGLRSRPRLRGIWVALGVAVVYGMLIIRMGISPVERTHLIEYSLVAVLIYQALAERKRNGRKVPYPAIIAIFATFLLGWIDEGIQAILPNRIYDIRDVGFNALAGFMAVSASLAMGWAQRKVSKSQKDE